MRRHTVLIFVVQSLAFSGLFSVLMFAPRVYAVSQIKNIFFPYFVDISSLLQIVIPFMVTLAVLFFFWGLAKFVRNSGNEKELESGKNLMIWGTIAITIMASLWGIVAFMQSVFDIGNISNQSAPKKSVPVSPEPAPPDMNSIS